MKGKVHGIGTLAGLDQPRAGASAPDFEQSREARSGVLVECREDGVGAKQGRDEPATEDLEKHVAKRRVLVHEPVEEGLADS